MAPKMNTTTGGDIGNVMTADPLLDLARAIAAADTLVNDYDRKESEARKKKDGVSETYFEAAERHSVDQYYSLKEGLSCYEAKTMEGAMVQIAESFNLLDLLWDMVPEGPHDHDGKKIKRAIERMLMSSLRMMERAVGTDLPGLGLDCFRNANLDPWDDVERRIVAVKRGAVMGKAAIRKDRGLAEVIFDMEEDLHKVKALGHAMMAIFERGTGLGGLNREESAGGSMVAETMLDHFEAVMDQWRRAFELSRGERGKGD